MNTDAAVEEITNAFLPLWDGVSSGGQIWVVGATNKRDRLDEAIEQRFGESIEIGLPDAAGRQAILELELRKLESTLPVPEFVGKATSGLSGRNLSKVAATIYRQAAQRGGAATDDMWRDVIRQFGTTTADPVDPGATWDSLILPEATLKRLKRIAQMLRHAESLREQGIEPPRAALLFGPPGTGKTQIAKTLANESGLNFVAAGPSDIKAGYIGQSGLKIRELFERARAKPAILFIDEIDAGAGHRGGEGGVINDEIVTELIAQMEGVKKVTGTLLVLAATNHLEHVDAAVLSRFEDRIEIANPGPAERVRMLKGFIGRRRVDFDVDHVAEELAFVSDGLSGRDLMSAVRRASQLAVERALDAGTPDQIALSREDLVSQFAGRSPGQEAAS
jgi:transitional endoplasmic reticulum ATPase